MLQKAVCCELATCSVFEQQEVGQSWRAPSRKRNQVTRTTIHIDVPSFFHHLIHRNPPDDMHTFKSNSGQQLLSDAINVHGTIPFSR